MNVHESGEPASERLIKTALPAKSSLESGTARIGCAPNASNSQTPWTACAARRALEEIGHAVGAFDDQSAMVPYVAVDVVRAIVRKAWTGERPEWQPYHDTTEHGDCSPWCPACRKARHMPCK